MSAVFDVEYYETQMAKGRTAITVEFSGVTQISGIFDMCNINKNAWAGNINYWVRGEGGSPFYFYMVDGCISIAAVSVDIVRKQS
jgi:hypothetical protein